MFGVDGELEDDVVIVPDENGVDGLGDCGGEACGGGAGEREERKEQDEQGDEFHAEIFPETCYSKSEGEDGFAGGRSLVF